LKLNLRVNKSSNHCPPLGILVKTSLKHKVLTKKAPLKWSTGLFRVL